MIKTIQNKINKQLYEKLELAYFCVDHSMTVIEISPNLKTYGYENLTIGCDAEELVDFMVGVDCSVKLELPLVATPSGVPATVNMFPDGQQLSVLITNASVQAEQRQALQQKANENELLVGTQKKLMLELEEASRQLGIKNQQLEDASRLQTSFLSGVSHEFRTPLTSIIGYTNLVESALNDQPSSTSLDASNAKHLQAVQRSSRYLLSLVENLLDHGKLDSNEIAIRPKTIRLAEVVEDVELLLKPLSDAKSISLNFIAEFDESVLCVVDDSRLRQCLINIMGNAVKFTDHGGVTMTATLQDDVLSISVEDTGPGISAENLSKIRLPFWQGEDTGKPGTGLGLTITERLIELMGGQLHISSELGKGTKVNFDLLSPVVLRQEPANTLEAITTETFSILLAEDDSDISDLVSMMLNEKGVLVDQVENGAQAVEAASAKKYDLILMDIHMPVMTGYEALAELKSLKNPTPVVIMSASAIDSDRQLALDLGCTAYLVKPIDIDDIIGIAGQVIV